MGRTSELGDVSQGYEQRCAYDSRLLRAEVVVRMNDTPDSVNSVGYVHMLEIRFAGHMVGRLVQPFRGDRYGIADITE